MAYIEFNDLIKNVNQNNEGVRISFGGHPKHNGLVLSGKPLPVSINEHEFNYMRDFITKHNLTNGFELATGTGISTLSNGLGMKNTNGLLVSMDAYIEEKNRAQPVNPNLSQNIHTNSQGFKTASYLIKKFELSNNVVLECGMSPKDTIKNIEHHFTQNNKKINYVFFDCPKCDEDYKRDIMAIIPYIDKTKFAIFVHDTHTFGPKTDELNMQLFGKTFHKIYKYYEGTSHEITKHFPLGLITNIELS